MEFQYPWMFLALAIVPLVALVWLAMMRWKKKSMRKFGGGLAFRITEDYSVRRQIFKFLLFAGALTFILIGLTNPRIGNKIEKVSKKGRDIIVCLDISNSMRARDIKPDRLERSKMAISRLIDRLNDDQIGLIVFAGRAQNQFPLTPDYAGAKLYLGGVVPEMIAVQGTAIGSAIDLAVNSFNFKTDPRKVIILISDGENHEDDAFLAAERAAEKGVIIYTVGMGSPDGAPIPVSGEGTSVEYKKDPDGNTIITRLNEAMLQKIAETGKGTYFRGTTSDAGLDQVYSDMDEVEKKKYEAVTFSDYENLFPYFLAVGLFLLMFDMLIFEGQTKFTRNLKIFSRPVTEYLIVKKKK